MDDLRPTEFDIAYFIRAVSSGAGDGQISASRLAQNKAAAQRATEALREFANQLKMPSSGRVLNAYAQLAPGMPHLFSPLWAADVAPAMTAAALECIALASPLRTDVRRMIVRGKASAFLYVLKHNSRYLAKRVLNILVVTSRKSSVLAAAVARRFDLSAEAKALTQKQNRVCRLPFLRLVNALLSCGDRDVMRILMTSSRTMFLAAGGVVIGIMREEAREKNDDERLAKRPKLEKDVAQKRAERRVALERNDALTGALGFVRLLRGRVLTCKNEYLIRAAFEPPFIDRVAAIAAVQVPTKLKSLNDKRHKEIRDTARSVLFSVARSRRISRPYLVARALADTGVATSGGALSLVTEAVHECPHLARHLLQHGPFLPSQPQATTAWLSNAAVVMACTRQLTRPSDVFRTTNFFERTLNHSNRLVRYVGALILARFGTILEDSEDAVDILPPFALFQKVFIRNKYEWDQSVHTLFAIYRQVAAKEIAAEKLDPVHFAVQMAGHSVAMAEPTIRSSLEFAKEETLNTIFKEKVLAQLISIPACRPLAKDILMATELFPAECENEIELWLVCIDDAECAVEFESMISKARHQPFSLFDDAGCDVSLLAAAAVRRLAKRKDETQFDKYLARVLSALVAWETVLGRDAMESFMKRKLEQPQESVKANKYEADLINAVQVLEQLQTNNSFPALREICGIGRFLAELYSGACSPSELDSIWSECCAQFELGLKLDNSFFDYHAAKLASCEDGTDEAFRSYLWLLRMRQKYSTDNEMLTDSLSVEERAVFLRISLRNGKYLNETLKFVLRSGLDSADIVEIFEDAMLDAIRKTPQIERSVVKRFVTKALKLCTEKSDVDLEAKDSYTRFVFRVLVAFLNHENSAVRETCSVAIDALNDEQRSRLSVLGSTCIEPFTQVLDKVRTMIPACARFMKDLIEKETVWLKPAEYMQLMTFLANAKEAEDLLSEELLAKVSLAHPWKVTEDEMMRTEVQEKGFDLGASIGTRLSLDSTLDILLEHGPDSEVGSALAWWSVACGVLSTVSKRTIVSDASVEKARKLIELIASQIGSMHPTIMNCIHRGPLETIMWLLQSANLQATHVQHGTEEYNFANNLCAFVSAIFKQSAAPQMSLIGTAIPVEREIMALRQLSVVLKCASTAVSVPEIGLNLSRLVLHTFSENLPCFKSIGNAENRIESSTRAVCEDVLRVFVEIVAKVTKLLQAVGMDARSATALTNMEQLFCTSSFTFFASRSKFDQLVLQSMKHIKSCMQKDDFRRQRQLPNLRAGLFSPLAANVAPILNSERLRATATFIMRQLQQPAPRPDSVFPASLDDVETMPYEPVFVLKTLRLACEYAAYTKEATVLDLNVVVNGGLLRVAFAGIASDDEQIRMQAYAALDALSRVIGPEYGNAKESAAALYVNRRPLALVLGVLKDSINEPLKQVLPLFSSWLWHVLKILVRPSHKAYVGVMRYILRIPIWDVNDCAGVVYLMKGTEVGVDPVALRHLALDVIEQGLWGREDHVVARKRRLYDYLLILGGSSIGIDATVRDKAVRLIAEIVGRFPAGQVAIQLCRMHSFASCMVPQITDEVEMRMPHLMNRVDALKEVARRLPRDYDLSCHAQCVAGSFGAVVRAVRKLGRVGEKDMHRLRDCARVVEGLGGGRGWWAPWLEGMKEAEAV